MRRASLWPALALTVLSVLATGGCARLARAADFPGAPPSLPAVHWPAGAAGAACGLLDYGQVAKELGTTFDTAGGAEVDNTVTCAVNQAGRAYPTLSLSLSATKADDLIFSISAVPANSAPVKGLGRAAYVLPIPAGDQHGPGLEYGWLSAKPRLGVVRYFFAPGATDAEVTALKPKLLVLAQRVEKTAP